jgi:hypothetical protein
MDHLWPAKISRRFRAELESLAGYRPHGDAEQVFTLDESGRAGAGVIVIIKEAAISRSPGC